MPVLSQPMESQWAAQSAPAEGAWQAPLEWEWHHLALFFGLHGGLGLAMHKLPALATIHAFFTIAAVIAVSLFTRRPALLFFCMCYVSGAEVLWRMSSAFVFSETAKYMIVLISAIGLVRLKGARLLPGPLLYLGLLLPSAVITYFTFRDFDFFRKAALFSLSGPMAIAAGICFCANLRMRASEFWRGVMLMAMPLMGVAAVTLVSTYGRQGVRFTTSANFETSGGFGPNQVASALALGALMLGFGFLLSRGRPAVRALLLAVCFVQSMMTFSRGGVVSSGLALLAVSPLLARGRRQRAALLAGAGAVAVAAPLVFSALNDYTGGKLAKRFTETEMSGREELIETDIAVWMENPVFGVGPGISRFYHRDLKATHTEFSRALAENGSLGALAYLVLGLVCLQRLAGLLRSPAQPLRAVLVAGMIWAVLYMVVNANRTSGPALAMSLAFLTVVQDRAAPAAREEPS